ncbi:MAG: RICIN domain-containing protein [Coriobacteriales bacterium]|jgi:hypothetical protein|nr:RICIN domain-containing protein [Coriobacteriales bacterium]
MQTKKQNRGAPTRKGGIVQRMLAILTALVLAVGLNPVTPAFAEAVDPTVFTVYTQIGDDEGTRVVVAEYTQAELDDLAAPNTTPLAYVADSHGAWKAYVTKDYVFLNDLLTENGLEFTSGDVLVTSTTDEYVSANDDFTWQVWNSSKSYYPATTATALDTTGATEVEPVLALSYASTAAAELPGTHLDTTAAVAVADMLADYAVESAYSEGDIPRTLFGATADAHASNRFAKNVSSLTLVRPPALTEFVVYEQFATGDPIVAKTFTAADLAALAQTTPRGFLMYKNDAWAVFGTKSYVPVNTLLSEAGVGFAAGDSIIPKAGDGFSRTFTYEAYTAGEYFYPATTLTSTALDDPAPVGAVLALNYQSGDATPTAGAALTNIVAGQQQNEARFLIGVSEADYLAASAAGNRLVTAPLQITVVHPYYAPSAFDGEVITIALADTPYQLDIPGSSKLPAVQAALYTGQPTANQRFKLEADEDGYYTIINVGSGLALDVSGGNSAASGSAVIQYTPHDGDNQKWSIVSNGDGSYTFVSKLSETLGYDLVLDVSGGAGVSGSKLIAYEAHGGANQKFSTTVQEPAAGIADGRFTIESAASSAVVLDISGGSLSAGAALIVYEPHGGTNQQFDIAYDPATGYYTIKNVKSELSLDLFASLSQKGAPIVQWTANGAFNQLWDISASPDGGYIISSARTGQVLDISGGAATNGNKVIQWPEHGGPNQRWILIP